ncbi:NAD(P)H-dependent glycerol-3-phosphate dehydrogenase [Aquisalimonas asiatica]|uniref:Glycerol-3-phosphate dehydrogenase [NAD(P)+] n=1 Tax=Aquisalimonas asiatica TaxID=406100 RepID=A0A1H8UBX5_9GAMM|nr:NAD(P)H-dependent glycerol-3-phosphate dehydrogenase [Aquisalimonas asiatica]SEP00762.1 glycerol 3-phosphate dehydrogenase (NAD(P)+) [Aquisalimonas asiatica]
MTTQQPIAVLGAGSWGTALALVLAHNGVPVRLWGHDPAHMAALAEARCNVRHLPDAPFPETLTPTDSLASAVDGAGDLLLVVPSHGFRSLVETLAPSLGDRVRIAWATKGLEAESGGLLHQVVEAQLPGRPTAVLSGPSFAREVAAGLPTAVTIASRDNAFAADLAAAFHGEQFRPYTSHDIIGVELGGAVKNVLAVATGIADGLGLGANTRAGLITRGLAEVVRLGEAMGAESRTFMGLSGVGDLILTSTDDQSRNRRLGLALGRGQSVADAVAEIGQTVESVRTAAEVHALAEAQGVEMPICEQVHAVVNHQRPAREALEQLMARARKSEF